MIRLIVEVIIAAVAYAVARAFLKMGDWSQWND